MKAPKVLLISSSLLILASCGENDKSSSHTAQLVQKDPVITNINWKINFPGKHLPDNLLLEVNGSTLLDECSGGKAKSIVKVDRGSSPMSLSIPNYYMPKRGELAIEVKDLGVDCGSETEFVKNENVEFEVLKNLIESELVINL